MYYICSYIYVIYNYILTNLRPDVKSFQNISDKTKSDHPFPFSCSITYQKTRS